MSAGSRTVQLRSTSAIFNERIVIPLVSTGRRPIDFVVDVRRGGEAFLLLAAVALAVRRLCQDGFVESGLRSVVLELLVLCAMALVHPVLGAIQSNVPITSPVIRPADQRRHLSPPASVPQDREMAFLWMTDARDYRECPDDGAVTSLLFVPVVAATLLHIGLLQTKDVAVDVNTIPRHWLIGLSRVLPESPDRSSFTRIQSLILARRNLVHLSTLCSFVLFCHLAASRWSRWRSGCKSQHDSIRSQALRPKAEGRRNFLYAQFSIGMVALSLALRNMSEVLDMGLWQDLTYLDTALISFAYQFIIYVMVRLARRGFTLGELGLVAQGATALFMESVALTTAQIWPITTHFIRTYRSPTPLLIFQIALIPGAFLTGFLLSPLLVLSRNLAQKPLHRLRHPEQKVMFRRALAVGFYVLSGLILGGLIGSWTGWCLALEQSSTILHFMRDPWLWVVRCVLEGRRPWSRPALLIYWAALASISVAGWGRQLARARKTGKKVVGVQAGTGLSGPVTAISTSSSFQNVISAAGGGPRPQVRPVSREEPGAVSPTTTNFSPPPTAVPSSMTGLLDAADKRVPILTLNGRRKFFHALAVVMFVPGIASDPAFCHLAFSAAFALFIFVEYVRYFALYPFSAQVHVFMNEFIDDKDSGTAILSHFYLLTGCAGPIWLEGPSKLLEYTGVLTLGVGDAMASIVGKRWGRHQWTSNSPKTVEGSLAFTVSVVVGAWALRVVGLVEPFSTLRYTFAVMLSSVLEALSLQNDNLTLPFYMCTAPNHQHQHYDNGPAVGRKAYGNQSQYLKVSTFLSVPITVNPTMLDVENSPKRDALRPQSPVRSARSYQTPEKRRFAMRLKFRTAGSADNLISSPSLEGAALLKQTDAKLEVPTITVPERHTPRNVVSRLHALFPKSEHGTPRALSNGPPVLPAPRIPPLDITKDVLEASLSSNKPKDRPFLKMKIITWNHGYTIPKGDLSQLLGVVPPYEPLDEPNDTLPEFEADGQHPYHIIVVAGQECPSQSRMPLGLGAGISFGDKEKRLEKKRSKHGSKAGNREDVVPGVIQIPPTPSAYEVPGTPLPSKEYFPPPTAFSTPPSPGPNFPNGFTYQQMPATSAYSLKSVVSQSKASDKDKGEHHPVGWSAILEDWFCHGVGRLPGAKPDLTSELSLPLPHLDVPVPKTPSPKPSQANTEAPREISLVSPVRSATPDSNKGAEPNIAWQLPPNADPVAEQAAASKDQVGPYVLHAKERLMAIGLYIFVHRDVQHLVTGTSKSAVTTGLIGGRIGNKGGVGISLKVAGISLLFVNAHLAAHEDRAAVRVANMAKIKTDLDLDNFLEPGDTRAMSEDITDHFDHAFLFGDLNFRLNVTRLHAEWLISRKDYETALTFDQLKEVMKGTDHPFVGFDEGNINFPPTFKYDILRTLKKHHSVRAVLKDKAYKRRRGKKALDAEGLPDVDDASESSSSSSSDEDNGDQDARSMASSAYRSVQSKSIKDEDSGDPESLDAAAQNAIANSASYTSDVQAVALRAKEKFLSLVNRPPSPAVGAPAGSAPKVLPSVTDVAPLPKRPKSEISASPKVPPSPLLPPIAPGMKSAASSFDVPRSSLEGLKPPPLNRAQSTKSGTAAKEPDEKDDNIDRGRGVYDTSSKQRVPSWCDRILFKSNVMPEPEIERVPSRRFSHIFDFKRSRKDSAVPTNSSESDSPGGGVRLVSSSPQTSQHDHLPLIPTTPPQSDSPSRPSPLGRFFRQETFPLHAARASPSPKSTDRSSTMDILPSGETNPTARRRSFTTPVPPQGPPPATTLGEVDRETQVANPRRPQTPAESHPTSHLPWRWLFPRSFSGAREPSPPRISPEPVQPKHRKGEVVCVKYDTLDDRQMRLLEARSDHRPVMGDFAIYI